MTGILSRLPGAPRQRQRRGLAPAVRAVDADGATRVDAYWSEHTVTVREFRTERESEEQLEWRFSRYPLFRELSGLWGEHDGETVLDYGCGPGNDLTGFALHTGARRLLGLDVSEKALRLAADRLALHRVAPERVELIRLADSHGALPVEQGSIDFVNCQGVLHHTTSPESILSELHRVMRPGARGCFMVYNRDSAWYHLYTAYQKMIVEDAFPGLGIDAAFTRNTDGPDCPISRAWPPATFIAMCERAGLEVEWVGGYPSVTELDCLKDLWAEAIADRRLAQEHRRFLRELSYDIHGYPMYRGMHAGIGGIYRVRRPLADA